MEKNKIIIYLFIMYVVVSLILSSCSQDQVNRIREKSISNAQQKAQSPISFNAEKIRAKVDEYMNALVDLDRFSGSVLIARDGTVLIRKGYGMANKEHNIPNTPSTKFRLGSITKQFTAMVILILQEQGKLQVQDLVEKYVPDSPEHWKNVTIHHLMTNTSGIPNFQNFPDNLHYERLPTTVEKIIERFKDEPLRFAPGSKIRYSSSGYVLLGYIIEQVTGKSYEQVLDEYIFKPLDMKDSGYDHSRTVLMNRASGYSREDGQLLNAIHIEMDTPHAAGALYSTVDDMFLWDQALYTTKLISQETLDVMFTKHFHVSEELGYGYGWLIKECFSRKLVEHDGRISGFRTNFSRYPDDKVSIITLSNYEALDVFKINQDLAAIIFDEGYELPKSSE